MARHIITSTKRGKCPFGYKLKILEKRRPPGPFGANLVGNREEEDFFTVTFKKIQDKYVEECGVVDPFTMRSFKVSEKSMELILNGFKGELNNMNYTADTLTLSSN